MGRAGSGRSSFSASSGDYKLLEEVGYGASATVYRAIYVPSNEVVAIKCLDLDRCNSNLDDMRREAQTMSLIDHPNVIRAFCSFVVERNLWVVMPFMAEGSCLHLMKIAYPDGFEEAAIGSILKESLKALDYLHRQGHIHRDVKAGNILLDTNGMVKLGDFGVSACMFDAGDRQRSRNTFVGTPCWMAPEVLQAGSGYNSKADIWSFGITALELARGHAPFSKYPPMKVLLMTIQNAPPGFDSDNDKRFSKSFKEMVAMCLVKDQTKRPTAEKLLKHSFFKHAKPPDFSVKKLFTDLPPLWNRVKTLQLKDAAQLASKKMPSAEQEAMSQSEYQRGVSAWNFDIEDLKLQASLVQDDDDDKVSEIKEENKIMKSFVNNKDSVNCLPSFGKLTLEDNVKQAYNSGPTSCDESSETQSSSKKGKTVESDLVESGLEERIDLKNNRMSSEAANSEKDFASAKTKTLTARGRQTRSGPLVPGTVLGQSHSATEKGRLIERFDDKNQPIVEKPVQRAPSFSGPLMLPTRASANSLSAPIKSSTGLRDSLDDKSKAASRVQIRGRFSVTSENLDPVKDVPLSTVPRGPSEVAPLRKSASVGEWIFGPKHKPGSQTPNVSTAFLTSHLQNLFQQNTIQQDLILNLLNNLQLAEVTDGTQNGKLPTVLRSPENNGSVEKGASERERLLLVKVNELRTRMNVLTDELNTERLKFIHLKQQLNVVSGVQENGG